MMRLYFATIPLFGDAEAEAALNRFLAAHRVLSIDRHLVTSGSTSVWAVCISYEQGDEGATPAGTSKKASRIDYREHLSEQDFALFAKLRLLRKMLAERDGVPVYALFTNEQLATMAERRLQTLEELQSLSGVGPARVEKYGAAFLKLLQEAGPTLDSVTPQAAQPGQPTTTAARSEAHGSP